MEKKSTNSQTKKKIWTKEDFAKYYKESRELSDYACSKKGIIEYKKSYKKNKK